MTIQNNGTRNQYTATAAQTIFPYTFEIFASGDLTVEQNGSVITAYTVSGVGNDSGGNVTLDTGATAGDTITIYRDMDLERLTDYQNNGDFLASEVNDDYDRIWAALQQLQTNTQAAIRPSPSDTALDSSNTELASIATRGGKALGFASDGTLSYLSSAVPNGDFIHVSTVAAMQALTGLTAGTDVVQTAEFSTGNGGGGEYDVVLTTSVTPNGANIIQGVADENISFVLRVGESVISDQFGTSETGDTTTAMQAAVDYAAANGYKYVELSGDYTITNLEKMDQVKVISGDKPSTITIGATVFNVPYRDQTSNKTELYVATTGSDSTNCGMASTVPFATIQGALEFLPTNIAHDTIINIADGTYTDIGGKDEFGRDVNVDVSIKQISALREPGLALNEKAAKLIFRGASEAGTIIDGTDRATTRYNFWCHENPGIQFENITTKTAAFGIMSHQNSDVTLRDVTNEDCDFGRGIESNSRMEVLRGSCGTASNPNTRNYFIKNGQLQENDSTQAAFVENGFLIDGEAWVHLLRVEMDSTASKNTIDTTGSVWFELDDCNVYGGGNSFVVGTFSHMRLSNKTKIGDFTSSVFANEAGYVDTDGLCHIYNNSFISFITKGMPVFNLDNCDAKPAAGTHDGANNASVLTDSGENWATDQFVGLTIDNTTDGSSGTITANTATTITATLSGGTDNDWDTGDAYEIEAANTNGLRIQGSATSVLIDPDCAITSADRVLSRPTSGLVLKGTSAPSDVNSFYERGTIVLNEGAAVGQPQGWICTTKGYGGTAVFTAMPNL